MKSLKLDGVLVFPCCLSFNDNFGVPGSVPVLAVELPLHLLIFIFGAFSKSYAKVACFVFLFVS
jgi:hypothetical protein